MFGVCYQLFRKYYNNTFSSYLNISVRIFVFCHTDYFLLASCFIFWRDAIGTVVHLLSIYLDSVILVYLHLVVCLVIYFLQKPHIIYFLSISRILYKFCFIWRTSYRMEKRIFVNNQKVQSYLWVEQIANYFDWQVNMKVIWWILIPSIHIMLPWLTVNTCYLNMLFFMFKVL